eukprot:766278-Hanusia_phi.AAC.5
MMHALSEDISHTTAVVRKSTMCGQVTQAGQVVRMYKLVSRMNAITESLILKQWEHDERNGT